MNHDTPHNTTVKAAQLEFADQTLRKERLWLITLTALTLLAFVGHWLFPLTPDRVQALMSSLGLHTHLGGHHFVDQRSWLGIPNAADVLSNLPFAALGAWGLWRINGMVRAGKLTRIQTQVLCVFFIGLLLTTVGSSLYHLAPSDTTLLWDRAGMAIAFAGVLGIAACDRISAQSGRFALRLTLVGAALALWVWRSSGDVLPWSVVQFGGIVLVLALAWLKPLRSSLGVSLFTLIAFYTLAKVLESSDAAVFELTQHWVSGHSLKHIIASLAALPVIAALYRAKAV